VVSGHEEEVKSGAVVVVRIVVAGREWNAPTVGEITRRVEDLGREIVGR
jgi:hypothetical protein